MSRKTLTTATLTLAMIAIWNFQLFKDWKNGAATVNTAWRPSPAKTVAAVSATEPELWREIKKTVLDNDTDVGFNATFSPTIKAVANKSIELPGVGFLLSSGLHQDENGNERISEFLLLPSRDGVAWCCGLAPIPKHEFSVLVDCKNVPDLPSRIDQDSKAFFVSVKGTLRLEKDNNINSLYTLEDVAIKFLKMADVAPPNVLNACLNKPMQPHTNTGSGFNDTTSSTPSQRHSYPEDSQLNH